MNIEEFADTLETTTESEDTIVLENPLDKIDKGKKPLHLTYPRLITDVNKLAEVLTDFHQKYVKHEDQVVFFKITTTKECYLDLFRTRKPNSKELVEFYEKSYNYFIQNHISNRLWNNSDSGKMTQLRIVMEGILGSCFITDAPAGISTGQLEQYLSIIDKGNWTIFHNDIFNKIDTKNGIKSSLSISLNQSVKVIFTFTVSDKTSNLFLISFNNPVSLSIIDEPFITDNISEAINLLMMCLIVILKNINY